MGPAEAGVGVGVRRRARVARSAAAAVRSRGKVRGRFAEGSWEVRGRVMEGSRLRPYGAGGAARCRVRVWVWVWVWVWGRVRVRAAAVRSRGRRAMHSGGWRDSKAAASSERSCRSAACRATSAPSTEAWRGEMRVACPHTCATVGVRVEGEARTRAARRDERRARVLRRDAQRRGAGPASLNLTWPSCVATPGDAAPVRPHLT